MRSLSTELAPDAASQLRARLAAAVAARPNGHGQALVGPLESAHREYMTVIQLPGSLALAFQPLHPEDIAKCVWRPEGDLISDFLGSEFAFQHSRGRLLQAAVAGLRTESPPPLPAATALSTGCPPAGTNPDPTGLPRSNPLESNVSGASDRRRSPASGGGGSGGSASNGSDESESESSFVDEVDFLVDSRFAGDGSVEFLVRWSGYSPRHDTWEPEINIGLPLLQAFRAQLRTSPGASAAAGAVIPLPRPAFLAQLDYKLMGSR